MFDYLIVGAGFAGSVLAERNEHAYTRVTEFKHLTGQEHAKTSLVYEYPCTDGDPYYPVPRAENNERYKQYKALAEATTSVHFVGRLATYKYYNMDQVIAQALTVYNKIVTSERSDEEEENTGTQQNVLSSTA